jgi:sterol 3beta-glucosyltransferase
MNQSLFSMIARAGQQSQVDLSTMHEVDSGDSEGEEQRKAPYRSLDGAARLSRLSTTKDFHAPLDESKMAKAAEAKHKRAPSENKLLRSLPKLKMSSRKDIRSEGQPAEQMSSSQFLPPRPVADTSRDASPPTQPSRAKARGTPGDDIHIEKVRKPERVSKRESKAGVIKSKGPVSLATRIQQIFEFEEAEEVISEYPCWLLQSILLQGYMYITQNHVCFYAYIPKKHVSILKFN